MEDYQYHEFDLGFAKRSTRNWTSRYFKSNSRKPATIKLRVWSPGPDAIFWKYYIELHVAGKMIEQIRIRPEAFDALDCDPSLVRTHYTGVDFTILKTIN